MSSLQSFQGRVERFLKRSGVSATELGRLAARDPNFVFDLRDGRRPNLDLCDQVIAWMRKHQEAQKKARVNSGRKRDRAA